ncbi:MAG: hypothetical protein ABIQ55_00400 [Gemmatimonadaceae bacterium]
MRIAILANEKASFIQPIAEGLARMLRSCGAEPVLVLDGLENLALRQSVDFTSVKSFAGSAARLSASRRSFDEFVTRLEGVDAIVVVANVPISFSRSVFPNIEVLRDRLPNVPIVNYDLHYLPTLDSWARLLLRGEKTKLGARDLAIFKKGGFGLERYDWYLMAAAGTELALPPGPQPFSLIGLDLDDGTLFPGQNGEFRALIDFEQNRGDYPGYRAAQLDALRLAGVNYTVLDGSYSRDEIRAIYRRSSIYFLASAESFGLPICELQACGAKVFLPNAYWAASHWLGEDLHSERTPALSPNFVIYEDNARSLAKRIGEVRDSFDPGEVRGTFKAYQPQLLHGDLIALKAFLTRLESGEIHSRVHLQHAGIGREPPSRLSIRR